MTTWNTAAEASAVTNVSLTTGDLQLASSILEIYVGVTPAARTAIEAKSKRDLRLLKKAEAFQAAWMKQKPALLERSDVDNVIQDSLQFSKSDQDAHVIAPLAKAAIQRLSWRSARTIDPLTPSQAAAIRGKFYAETIADNFWRSVSGGGWSEWVDL